MAGIDSLERNLNKIFLETFHISKMNCDKIREIFLNKQIIPILQSIPADKLEFFVKGILKSYCCSFIQGAGFPSSDFATFKVGAIPLLFYINSAGLITEQRYSSGKLICGQFTDLGDLIGKSLAGAILESMSSTKLVKRDQVGPWFLMQKFAREDQSFALPTTKPRGFRYDEAHQLFPVALPQGGKSFSEFLELCLKLECGWFEIITDLLKSLDSWVGYLASSVDGAVKFEELPKQTN